MDRDDAEEQTVGGKGEGDRVAEQKEDDQCGEHQRRHVGDQQLGHSTEPFRNSSAIGS